MQKVSLVLMVILVGCSEIRGEPVAKGVAGNVAVVVKVDELVGIYNIEVTWNNIKEAGPRNWRGEVHIERCDGGIYYGNMRLGCVNMNWVVDQKIAVSMDGGIMTIQGSDVKEIEVPNGRGGYGWDVFKLKKTDKVWMGGDAAGEHAGNGVVKMIRIDFASNQSLNSSPLRVAFQLPGSGQEFAD